MKEFKSFKCFFLIFCLFFGILVYSNAQNSLPIVQNINVTPFSDKSLIISWSIPPFIQESKILEFKIFRDTKPIDKDELLTQLKPIATLPKNSISYTDRLSDFINYYYAVAIVLNTQQTEEQKNLYYDEELDNIEKKNTEGFLVTTIIPGSNATPYGSHVAEQNTYTEDINFEQNINAIEEKPNSKTNGQISAQTEQEVKSLIKGYKEKSFKTTKKLEPYIFIEDEQNPLSGDDYLLYEIVQNYFVTKNYTNACKMLEKFLAQNRSYSTTQRATFYLGQSYYFCQEYIDALHQFLKIDESYPILYAKWTDSCIDLMAK